jgi:hypothetical protein
MSSPYTLLPDNAIYVQKVLPTPRIGNNVCIGVPSLADREVVRPLLAGHRVRLRAMMRGYLPMSDCSAAGQAFFAEQLFERASQRATIPTTPTSASGCSARPTHMKQPVNLLQSPELSFGWFLGFGGVFSAW